MKSDDRRLSLTYTAQHGIISLSLLVLLCTGITTVGAQPTPNGQQTQYARFSPSLAIIIVVLVGALFFMAFFSIYIRRCNDTARGIVHPNLSMRRRAAAAAARGLDQTVIDSFPTFKYSAVKGLKIGKGALECAVCLNEFEDDETLRLIPKCDHVFHTDCIDAWLTSHVTCPVCRADLVPQPGDPVELINPVEFDNHVTGQVENPQNGDVSIRVDDANQVDKNNGQQETSTLPLPLPYPPPRSRSVRRPRLLERFRSHSTGHSLVQPGENMDRFTLRLPEDVRKQMMRRALLTRGSSSVVVLPREGSSRRGYRTGEGSGRGKTYRRLDSLDGAVKSDRWGFSRMPSFLTRAFSVRSPKVVASDGEASTSTAVKMPPDSPLPKSDQTGLVNADSARPPV